MTQPTHTHRELGGKYIELQQHEGAGPLVGQWLVIYEDLSKGIQSATTQADWMQNWRAVAPDDCTVCMGTGTDHIKGNAANPCGHCYGLGKVREDGEAAGELWELATIAGGIIQRQLEELLNLRRIADNPAIQELIEQQRQQAMIDGIARDDQAWRNGQGFGPGGQRYTGD
ncbi:hypothetical protein [Vreelandella populi]|uniref:Uncharacterized protein n=1 Tax=Vreelandella populi TaxID=2498858 RepID=A0A3S1E572_9GAMM|nr:hypothetical protein [Halomonas populi]RUR43333.1 hypothetical protein ELY37_16585 [Halomonas populi]